MYEELSIRRTLIIKTISVQTGFPSLKVARCPHCEYSSENFFTEFIQK